MKNLILFIMLAAGNLSAADLARVALKESSDGTNHLVGDFFIDASSITAWAVLTDYNNMPNFVSSVKYSAYLPTSDNVTRIEQRMTGQAGIFHKRVMLLLRIKEEENKKIEFEDELGKSFKKYSGAWTLEPTSSTLHIVYELEAKPNFFSPDFLSRGAFKKNVQKLLEEVREEILRREILGGLKEHSQRTE